MRRCFGNQYQTPIKTNLDILFTNLNSSVKSYVGIYFVTMDP